MIELSDECRHFQPISTGGPHNFNLSRDSGVLHRTAAVVSKPAVLPAGPGWARVCWMPSPPSIQRACASAWRTPAVPGMSQA